MKSLNLIMGSCFSGIDGLALGLEWAGLGTTVWHVEKDPKCRAVLARHWPDAELYDDICNVGAATLARVDLICGGFPCQDISSAGRRTGLAGARSGLWYQFARVIAECRPRWVVIENVRSGARKYVDAVRGELGRLGYASFPFPLSASDCGAPHQRSRVFIVGVTADFHGVRRQQGSAYADAWPFADTARETGDAADAHGDVVRNEHWRVGGTRGQSAAEPAVDRSDTDNPVYAPLSDGGRRARLAARFGSDPNGHGQLQPQGSESAVGRWSCDSRRIWTVEPDVARVVHGLPGRVDRERMLGNSVLPQDAEVIGHVIRRLAMEAA